MAFFGGKLLPWPRIRQGKSKGVGKWLRQGKRGRWEGPEFPFQRMTKKKPLKQPALESRWSVLLYYAVSLLVMLAAGMTS